MDKQSMEDSLRDCINEGTFQYSLTHESYTEYADFMLDFVNRHFNRLKTQGKIAHGQAVPTLRPSKANDPVTGCTSLDVEWLPI